MGHKEKREKTEGATEHTCTHTQRLLLPAVAHDCFNFECLC